jgi:hypothetical protein
MKSLQFFSAGCIEPTAAQYVGRGAYNIVPVLSPISQYYTDIVIELLPIRNIYITLLLLIFLTNNVLVTVVSILEYRVIQNEWYRKKT